MIDKLNQLINNSNSIVFFGGAGVSTESGIPDFRSKDGLYNTLDIQFEKYSPEYLLSQDCLKYNPEVFFEFYRQKMDCRNVEPNIAHKVLAKMEKMGKLDLVITQNIDGLHQKAGSTKVAEIHGTTLRNHCRKCWANINDANFIFDSKDKIPKCPHCGGVVRPCVVLYGEELPWEKVNKASNAIAEADLIIIGGTSLTVYPAADLVATWRNPKAKIVIINKEETILDTQSDLVFHESIGRVFEQIKF